MNNILTYSEHPNFSVVVPNQCGCCCSFCFDDKKTHCLPFDKWFKGLLAVMEKLPSKFERVSVTGGEITLFDQFTVARLLAALRRQFKVIVVNTNGNAMSRCVQALSLADHVNLSYHGCCKAESDQVFGRNISPSKELLTSCISGLADMGTSVRLQRVVKSVSRKMVMFYLEWAKEVGAEEVCFRLDIGSEGGLSGEWIPIPLSKAVSRARCPVCAEWEFRIADMPVLFKAGVPETGNLADPYELIYRKDGKLSTMWSKYMEPRFIKEERSEVEISPLKTTGWRIGCGGGGVVRCGL